MFNRRVQAEHKDRRPPKRVTLTTAPFAAVIPGDSVVETVVTTGLTNFLNLYNSALVVRLVLTWFPNPPEVIVGPLSTICDPYLNLFRGIIPPLGGTLDFSPILAFVLLNLFTGATAALPCELGPDGRSPRQAASSSPMQWFQPTRYQEAWARRMQGQKLLAQQKDMKDTK